MSSRALAQALWASDFQEIFKNPQVKFSQGSIGHWPLHDPQLKDHQIQRTVAECHGSHIYCTMHRRLGVKTILSLVA